MKFGMVFPGQGSQSKGMLEGYGDAPEVREVLAVASEVLKQDIAKLIADGPTDELQQDGQHPAGDADGGLRCVSRLARARRAGAGGSGGPQPGRVHRARSRRRPGLRGRAPTRAAARAGDAGRGSGGQGSDGGGARTGRRGNSCGVRRSGARRSRRGGELQCTGPGGHRGSRGGRGASGRRGARARRTARRPASRQRAVPFVAARAGSGTPSGSTCARCRSSGRAFR